MNLFIFVWGIKNNTLFLSLFFLLTNLLWALLSNFGAKMCTYIFFHFFHKFVFLSFLFYFFNLTLFSFNYLIGIFINKRCIICFCSTKCVIMKPKSSLILPYCYLHLLLLYTKRILSKRCLDKSVFGNWTKNGWSFT